jgi:hypothetical protein
MEPTELALFTTQELIDELVRRSTFLGVVVHAQDEHRQAEWTEDKIFRVQFNKNLEPPQVGRLLDTCAQHIDRLD